MQKICKQCSRKFNTHKHYQEFCCRDCYAEWLKTNGYNYKASKTKECPVCHEIFDLERTNSGHWSTRIYCSEECKQIGAKKKLDETNLKLYGTTIPMKLEEIKNKMLKTKLARYGNTSGNCAKVSDTWKNKSKEELKEIVNKRENTFMKKYGVISAKQLPENVEKSKQTCLKRYGVTSYTKTKEYLEKTRSTNKIKYNSESFLQSKAYKDTLSKRYGVDSPLKSKRILDKKIATQHENGTFCTSKDEEYIYKKLLTKYNDVIRQYKSELYPFDCDFYIPSVNLYIEYQGNWTHSDHPFANNNEDKEELKKLKEAYNKTNSDYYLSAIDVWTKRDPNKRKIAKKNNLNWIEFFTLKEFNEWFILQ